MFKPLKLLTAAGLLMAAAASANAAPISAFGQSTDMSANSAGNLIEVHGGHKRCRYGLGGWHRHVWRHGKRIRIPCHSYRRNHRHRHNDACIIIGDFLKICPDD